MASGRGKHRSSDKDGRRTIALLESLPGIKAVIIGESKGGKNLGRNRSAGFFKLQGETSAGFKGILQTSRGVQQIAIILDSTRSRACWEAVRGRIEEVFPHQFG